MKKFICFILVLTLGVFVMLSCGKDEETDAERVSAMFAVSQPTKLVVVTEQQFNTHNLKGVYSIVVGSVDGVDAAVETTEQYRLSTVEEGSTQTIIDYQLLDSSKREYIADRGVRVDGGSWDSAAPSIIPAKGSMAINLDQSLITDVKYENKVLTFKLSAANSASVLGEGNSLPTDATVAISNDGALITGITITYTVPANAETGLPENVVTITANYTYDVELITIE